MFEKQNINRLSWEDIENYINNILKEVEEYKEKENINIDMLVPIIRGGLIPGAYISYKIKNLNICPIQFKYIKENDEYALKNITSINNDLVERFKDKKINIIITDGNTVTGNTANNCIKQLRTKFNVGKIIFTTITQDYFSKDKINADYIVRGKYTNEIKRISKEECEKLGIEYDIINIFPWKNAQEELDEKEDKYALKKIGE